MKKLLNLSAFILVTHWLGAQITISAADYFPSVGDTLKTAIDISPDGVVITQAGGPFTWSFTELAISVEQEQVYKPASEGSAAADFQGADLFSPGAAGGETYYNIATNAFEALGFNGPDPAGIGLLTLFKFTNPIPERHAPLTFPANYTSSSAVLVPFATADIPGGLIDSLGLPFVPDSIRVRITTQRNDFVDAYGTLAIPGGTYPVLREKRTEFRETRIDARIPILGWQDITSILIAGGTFEGLGKDTVVTYNFFSNEAKEPIAVVTMDDTGTTAQQVRFKNNGVLSGISAPLEGKPTVALAPNPVASQAVFQFNNFVPGTYTLQIFSVNGVLVFSRNIQMNGALATERIDLSALSGGQYFYRLSDEKQTAQASGNLLKINP